MSTLSLLEIVKGRVSALDPSPLGALGAFQDIPAPKEVTRPPVLVFEVENLAAGIEQGIAVAADQALGSFDGLPVNSPTAAGKLSISSLERGSRGRPSFQVRLEEINRDEGGGNDETARAESGLLDLIDARGVVSKAPEPRPLVRVLRPGGDAPGTLVVNAVDPEPGIVTMAAALLMQGPALGRAASILARVCGAGTALLAVPADLQEAGKEAVAETNVDLLLVSPRYPNGLNELVARRAAARSSSGRMGIPSG